MKKMLEVCLLESVLFILSVESCIRIKQNTKVQAYDVLLMTME